jgi:nitroimidazol reductase NimA-like FMN-containing flavoprotein (pyridoxamine 5'-phosphate oxidase superfamily)
VSPQDLTGISVAFSRLIDDWEQTEGSIKICLRDIESLLPYHDPDLVYRFLNTVLATLQGSGADVHAHFRPAATDEQTLQLLASLFEHVIDSDESTLASVTESASEAAAERETTADRADSGTDTQTFEAVDSAAADERGGSATTMTEAQIDDFLADQGYGVLALDGSSPYAIPMSYGYDPERRVLYSHMSLFEGSTKQARLDESADVSMVVVRYERPDRWRSVVVEGTLSRLSKDDVRERDVLDAFTNSELASVDVFTRDLSDVSFDWFALTPSSLTGRQSRRDR